jgi:primosomal protein N' (replication factor Y)
VLFFLNRRGYAPLTLCRACGHRWLCPNCDTSRVEHRCRRALVCHHCGHVERTPTRCVACDAEDTLAAIGPGVERLAEEVAETFAGARAIVLSSDFPGGTERLRREFEAVEQGEFQIVVGTQLVAKGHNFPLLTLAAVIDADIGLMNGDPRAAERSFQVLQQVTGRAGRGERPGRGLLQTWQPEHPVMRALVSGDTEAFYAQEIASRRAAGLPPFGRLAGILVSGPDKQATDAQARALARAGLALCQGEARYGEVVLLGPAEAPLAMLRGRHRIRLLAKAPRATDLQGFLRAMLAAGPKARGAIRVQIDIDPVSFY